MFLRKSFLKQIILASLFSFVFLSCDKRVEEQATPARMSIAKKIATSNDFTILQAAILKTGLASLLDSPGTYTVFAPTNEVMIASGITMDQINVLSNRQLEKLLKYHILSSRLFLDDFKIGVYYTEISLGGDSSFVSRNDQGLFVNGIKVIQTDLLQSNGIIHVPSMLLQPAQGDLLEVVAVDTSLTMFNAALRRTAKSGTDLTNALICGCKYTLFAPSNDAFRLAGIPTLASIEFVDTKKLIALLSNHITKERLFSSDWSSQLVAHTINGRQIQFIQNGNEYLIKGDSNLLPVKVIKHNTMATHGIVHTIEKVLE
jgi:uncharacterized surface protein with fasciclin (FAS1) repeats